MPMSSDLRNAFNAAAAGKATAAKAFHRYAVEHDVQVEMIWFEGTLADGEPFKTESPKLRPGSDLLAEATKIGVTFANPEQQKATSP